ncbi:hypothetical protein CJA_2380 [Cellvibrio japonicus Ueda107]|uniref:Uncharacterized protein n=2 Tax=Cellvibrio japonicus TaxID=155077 RepID=B3PKB2_CELJU|nr:hypothetical protein CJA_2380 [Cellvibrio japonicus Ueda107]
MSRKIPDYCMPADFFCRHNLELSFRLLRNKHPLLANALKIALDELTPVDYQDLHASYTGEMLLNSELIEKLSPQVIGQIVSSLTNLGRQALQQQDLPPRHIAVMRTLIEDWVALTEWILNHSSADTGDKTSYH